MNLPQWLNRKLGRFLFQVNAENRFLLRNHCQLFLMLSFPLLVCSLACLTQPSQSGDTLGERIHLGGLGIHSEGGVLAKVDHLEGHLEAVQLVGLIFNFDHLLAVDAETVDIGG